MKLAKLGLFLAYAAFAVTFQGPRERFWDRMTKTGLVLGVFAIAGDGTLQRPRLRPRDVISGAAIAAALYGIFQFGDRLARRILPSGDKNIGDIYELRNLRPPWEIALRLGAVIGPAEELFWRGLLLRSLTRSWGRPTGALAAASAYGGAHVITGNPALIGAASIAGLYWSMLAMVGVPMPALIISHVTWDIWIFLVAPTVAAPPLSRPEAR